MGFTVQVWTAVVTSHTQVWQRFQGSLHNLDLKSAGAEVVEQWRRVCGQHKEQRPVFKAAATATAVSSSGHFCSALRSPFLGSMTLNLFLHSPNEAKNICCLK